LTPEVVDRIYVDSSAFIALADAKDSFHQRAKKFAEALPAGAGLFTSDLVLAETFSNLQYHLGGGPARTFCRSILSGESGVELAFPTRDDLLSAQRILAKYHDQKFSLVDAVSFVLMENLGIREAFTFDRHFAVYRPRGKHFRLLPA